MTLMKKPQSTYGFLSYRLLRVANTIGLYASRRYRDEFEMTLPEWRVLSVIAAHEPTTARDVSTILATDKGWVSLSANGLRRRGFLTGETDPNDARRFLLRLTEEGWKKHNAIMVLALQRQQRLLDCLPAGSAELFVECLDRLQAEADAMLEEVES